MPDSERHFRIFGAVRAWQGDRELALGPVKQRTVLAVLLLAGGEPVLARTLRDCLWDEPPANAAGLVQTYVSRLRRAVGRSTLVLDAAGYRLDVGPEQVDLLRFRSLRARAEEAEEAGAGPRALLAAAFAEVRGRPCEDLGGMLRAHPLLVEVERELCEAAIDYADCEHAEGAGEVTRLLEWVVLIAPLDERVYSRLIRMYARGGHQAEALIAYERIRARLRSELGVGPGAELAAAYQATLAQRTLRFRPSVKGRVEPLVLVGRDAELSAVRPALARDRAITMVGPPGVGKTAIARALLHEEPGGGAFVALEAFAPEAGGMVTLEALAEAVLAVLSVPGVSGQPVTALVRELREHRLLLVLDGAEHVPLGCGRLVAELAHRCPEVSIVVTSRRPLGFPGENVREISALAVPPPGEVARAASFPAVALFLAFTGRSAADVDLPAVADVCRRLDGLPLALRLAASWPVSARPSGAVDLALAGLAGPISRSLELLTAEQRRLFARLVALPDELTLEEAERSAGGHGLDAGDIAMLLGDLVDHSLVQRAASPEHRFCISPPIRRVADLYFAVDDPWHGGSATV
ncbi:hypothetical protein J5X84_34105 [Streptosporangiaceae bacterium NEAU-GS5]|nr:hypothetical protein [Streptosporangiaceae bacterium NEAU-GS5]